MNALTDQKTFGSNVVVVALSPSPSLLFKTIATVSLRNDVVMLDVSVLVVEKRSRGVDDDESNDDESNPLESSEFDGSDSSAAAEDAAAATEEAAVSRNRRAR